MGLEAGYTASTSEKVLRYLQSVPSCLNDENWDKLCRGIFDALISGYPLPMPVKLPWYARIAEGIIDVLNFLKNL